MAISCKEPEPAPDNKHSLSEANTDKVRETASLPPDILLITMDTTRADHLGCYGYADIQTPNIDNLAREGVLFEEAFSVQPVTLPAHCSIHTGTYPFRHGVRDNNIYELGSENETLAERLTERGYLTTAFVASYILNSRFGLNQGFHFYNDRFVQPKQKGRLPVDRRASEVSFLATEWLREMGDEIRQRPFFLWLHYYDPHADYHPPHPYNTAYGNAYDGEIAYTDDWLGFFFDELKKIGKWDNTMVVLVGDHGEGLGEHGENTHGMFIYRATTHVPMIIKFPRNQHEGKRISQRVSQVDIVPTILETIGIKSSTPMDGRSLLPLMDGKETANRDVYSETYIPRSFHWSELTGLRRGDFFFVDAPLPEFYQTTEDENETENLYAPDNPHAKDVASALMAMTENVQDVTAKEVILSDELAARLEQLGYFIASGGLPDKSEGELPDPKTRIKIFNSQQKANNLFDSGRLEEAKKQYESILADDRNNPRLLMDLARLYSEMGDYGKAEKMYLRASMQDTENDRLFSLLGAMYRKWKKSRKATDAFEKALELNPKDTISLFHLSLIAMEAKDWTTARDYLNRSIAIQPTPAALNNLGYILIRGMKQLEDGIRYLKKAVALASDKAPFLHSLGVALLDAGRSEEATTVLRRAVEMVPDDPRYISALIRANMEGGRNIEAEKLKARLELLHRRFNVKM
jgi:arylsulfatase A-like enzyme/Tfp pilus assembly protein PilF